MAVLEDRVVESTSDGESKPVAESRPAPQMADRAGLYLAALIAMAVPSIVVLALYLPTSGQADSVDPPIASPTTGLDTTIVDDIIPPAEETSVAAEVAGVTEAPETPATTETPVTTVAEDVSPTPTVDLGLLDPESIEVSIYDESPSVDGEYTFAVRLKSVSTPTEIDTDLFTIVVEGADGTPAATSTRFTHGTLPVGSSALAAVRAADTGSSTNYVRVIIGDIEIARLPVEFSGTT